MARAEASAVGAERRLFIPRRGARCLLNEEELRCEIAGLGLETYEPAERSFAEPAATFSETEILLGNEGAALTGALLQPPGTTLWEMFSPGDGADACALLAAFGGWAAARMARRRRAPRGRATTCPSR